jgi:YggT family protein
MTLIPILMLVLTGLKILIFVDFALSWIMPKKEDFPRSWTTTITDPLYAPIRAVLRPDKMGGFDLSPMVVLILIQVMQGMIARAG